MLSLLSKFDAVVQKMVDSAAFFFMRSFGVTKGFLRYTLMALLVTVYASKLIIDVRLAMAVSIFLDFALMLMFVITNQFTSRFDADDEKKGMASRSDLVWRGGTWKLIGSFNVILASITFAHSAVPDNYNLLTLANYRLYNASILAAGVIMILLSYLAKTPNKPPPVEEKKSILVPAYATARK